jgi:uroporphyrinogen-III synthase
MTDSPLAGRRILVTRTQEGSAKLSHLLRELGAEAIEIPLIRIAPPASFAPLDHALSRIADYDVLLVTSANTARVLAERMPAPWSGSCRIPGSVQPFTAVIGPATAEAMRVAGLRVDLQPSPSVAESLVRELAPQARGKRMLLPRAEVAREVLPDSLRAAGATVDVVPAYRTLPEERSRALLQALFAPDAERIDAVTFTSGSTVKSFFELSGRSDAVAAFALSVVFSIGPITSAVLRAPGCDSYHEATTHDLDGLIACLCETLQA